MVEVKVNADDLKSGKVTWKDIMEQAAKAERDKYLKRCREIDKAREMIYKTTKVITDLALAPLTHDVLVRDVITDDGWRIITNVNSGVVLLEKDNKLMIL